MKKRLVASSLNCRVARQVWGKLSRVATPTLHHLTQRYGVSVG
jgi:hypothetical protein